MNLQTTAIQSLDELSMAFQHLNTDEYGQPLEILHGNSIGKHVRHVVEFFECLDLGNFELEVDYDDRKRNLFLETDAGYALDRIAEIQKAIVAYEEKMLTLKVDYGHGKQNVCTTLFRELVYNIEHCVHHLAILKIGIEMHFPHVELHPELGVAYSTQQFQKAS